MQGFGTWKPHEQACSDWERRQALRPAQEPRLHRLSWRNALGKFLDWRRFARVVQHI
jgi:hypothetical protein